MKTNFFRSLLSLAGLLVAGSAAAQTPSAHDMAVMALKNQSFVLEANTIEYPNGRVDNTTSTDNFVLMDGKTGLVQLTNITSRPGQNYAGGVTIGGDVTGVKSKANKKGNIVYQYDIQGDGVSAHVTISLPHNSNYASAYIDATFNSMQVTLRGKLLIGEQSDVFKAHPLNKVPVGIVH